MKEASFIVLQDDIFESGAAVVKFDNTIQFFAGGRLIGNS